MPTAHTTHTPLAPVSPTLSEPLAPESIPSPAAPPPRDDLPHALTFFLAAGERERILRRLRRYAPDRALALRIALGLIRPMK
jgi:hypothetical protein